MSCITEIRRLVVEFATLVRNEANDLYPFCEETHLFLALEQHQGVAQPAWVVINAPDWNYSNVAVLCRDRAWRAEEGQLLLNGEQVQAEAYLKAWRAAMATPLSFEEFLQQGFIATATISKPAAYCAAMLEAKEDHAFLQHLDSPLLSQCDAERVVWTLPLSGTPAIRTYNNLRTGYWSEKDYPGDFGLQWSVEGPTEAAATAAGANPIAQVQLFAEAA